MSHSLFDDKYNLLFQNIIGYMSVDGARNYHSDLSQLKFLNVIPRMKLHWNLNHMIDDAVKRTTDDNNEKINLLLYFLLDHAQSICLTRLNIKRVKPLIITYRRTLISIMCNAFGTTEPFIITGTLFNGCIYLCSIETEQEKNRRKSRTSREQKFCAWGYKFEQYVLSDLPTIPPDIQRPVVENEEFSLYYYSKLGDHELLYGAQIDGLYAVNKNVPKPPKNNDTATNLTYLKNNEYVELKTNREIYNQRQEQNFKKNKMFRCWCQCYLAGLKGLLVGFRNDDGIIQRLQWFSTEDIVAYCKDDWDPQEALMYLDNVLSFVQSSLRHHVESILGKEKDIYSTQPISLQFEFNTNEDILMNTRSDEIEPILPDWYLKAKG